MVRAADLIGEGKRQVVAGGAIHVDGVQGSVGTLHLQLGVLRDQENVRDVAAVFLVEVTALLREIEGFAGGNIF